MLSRRGPRNPGHSAGVSVGAGAGASIFATTGAAGAAGATGVVTAGVSLGTSAGSCRRRRRRRERLGLVVAPGEQQLLGSRRPPPVKLRAGAALDTRRSYGDERPAHEQDGHHQRRAPKSVLEMTCGDRPGDETKGEVRRRQDQDQVPLPGPGHRFVGDGPGREHRGDHQDDRADALEPARAAEQHPPHDDQQRADDAPKHSDGEFGIGRDHRGAEHHEQLDDGDDHSGPQPERFPRRRLVHLFEGHIGFVLFRPERL